MKTYSDKEKLTAEDYLLMEEQAEYKSEYHDGTIYPMAGGTTDHNHLCNRIGFLLELGLDDKNCLVLNSDQKVWAENYNSYMYPDVSVVCGKLDFWGDRKDIITNPMLIVEVLSESIKEYDWGGKFSKYKSLPSFKEYITISSDHPEVNVFFKQDETYWTMRT